jgi:RimJ/RimL family protein N-acetyltransferase
MITKYSFLFLHAMTFNMQPSLEDDLVIIRPLKPEHKQALFDVASDQLIWEQHPVKERAEPEGFDRFFQESLDSGGAVVIKDKFSLNVIGSSRYAKLEGDDRLIEIGWSFLARKYWGGKYNRAVKTLMFDHAFNYVDGVVLIIDKNNLRSSGAAKKIGASLMGVESIKFEIKPINDAYLFTKSKWIQKLR